MLLTSGSAFFCSRMREDENEYCGAADPTPSKPRTFWTTFSSNPPLPPAAVTVRSDEP